MTFVIVYSSIASFAYIAYLLFLMFSLEENPGMKINLNPVIIYGLLAGPGGWAILLFLGICFLFYKLFQNILKIEKMQPFKSKKEWD